MQRFGQEVFELSLNIDIGFPALVDEVLFGLPYASRQSVIRGYVYFPAERPVDNNAS